MHGIREPSRVHCLACIFFPEICIPRASTLAKKPAKPQSTKQYIRRVIRCKIKYVLVDRDQIQTLHSPGEVLQAETHKGLFKSL